MRLEPLRNKSCFPANLEFDDRHPTDDNFQAEILHGLQKENKSISPKFFYDERGSDLFLQITDLPEYYITRTEKTLLPVAVQQLKGSIGPGCHLIEYGCGNSGKASLLLEGLERVESYLAIDISKSHLLNFCQGLATKHRKVKITAVCADFTSPIDLDFLTDSGQRVAFFPGSSIGNFNPEEAACFLANVRSTVGPGGGLLIGVDLKKNPKILYAAYNDRQGVTAQFNLNLLRRINREAAGHFDLSKFGHRAFYNESEGRVEMHLESLEEQTVSVGGIPVSFQIEEIIHTENSHKFSVDEFRLLAKSAGWTPQVAWVDVTRLFSIHYLKN